jgi:hypothetical protein
VLLEDIKNFRFSAARMNAHHASALRLALGNNGGKDAPLCRESRPEAGGPVQPNFANDTGSPYQGDQLVNLPRLGYCHFRMQP